ncbi:MAG: sulfite exporter TauE/SafE family protein [Bacteroidetes bacterium]|nr:sulfite exporter TauE/SafE family protein [Bacteroidota bacterium]
MDMLPYCLIAITAFLASLSTFFSGFGLGTILLPVFSLFFSPEIALATTALVHLINGLFKVALTFKNINWPVFMKFGSFAFFGSIFGAYLIYALDDMGLVYSVKIDPRVHDVNYTEFSLGLVMLIFSLLEFTSFLENRKIGKSWISFGGFVSGFFGGFSGHQGAVRSAFLSNTPLSKFEFVATSALLGVIIDLTRISSYSQQLDSEIPIELVATGAAFAILGSILGNQLLKKTEMWFIKWVIGCFLFTVGTLMLLGLL